MSMHNPEWHSHMNNLQSDDSIINNICQTVNTTLITTAKFLNKKWNMIADHIWSLRKSKYPPTQTTHFNWNFTSHLTFSKFNASQIKNQKYLKSVCDTKNITDLETYTKSFEQCISHEGIYRTDNLKIPVGSIINAIILTVPKSWRKNIDTVSIHTYSSEHDKDFALCSIPSVLLDWTCCKQNNDDTFQFNIASFLSLPFINTGDNCEWYVKIKTNDDGTLSNDVITQFITIQLPENEKNTVCSNLQYCDNMLCQGVIEVLGDDYYRIPHPEYNNVLDCDHRYTIQRTCMLLFRWTTSDDFKAIPLWFQLEFDGNVGTFRETHKAEQCLLDKNNTPADVIFPDLPGTPPWKSEQEPNTLWYAIRFSNVNNHQPTALINSLQDCDYFYGQADDFCKIRIMTDCKVCTSQLQVFAFTRNIARTQGGIVCTHFVNV